jgi:hypothetical protein
VDRFPSNPDPVAIDEQIPGMDMPMDHGGAPMDGIDHGMQH